MVLKQFLILLEHTNNTMNESLYFVISNNKPLCIKMAEDIKLESDMFKDVEFGYVNCKKKNLCKMIKQN